MSAPDALDRLRDVFRRDRAWVASTLSDWFYTYHADLYLHGVPFEVYERKIAAVRRELGDARRVLDLGAGFGVYACLLRLAGVEEVVALDYHAEKTRVASALARHCGLSGLRVVHGDGLALPFPPGTFDGAVAFASLSHVRDAPGALRALASVLRAGGRLYVFEDNNSRWSGYARLMEPVWEHAESAPGGFVEIRRGLIRARRPDLPGEEADRLAKETRGLYGRSLEAAVDGFVAGGRLDNPRRLLVCDPRTGEFDEYPLHPAMVTGMLRDAGFEARLRSPYHGPWRGRLAPLKALAGGVYALCPALLSWTSPIYAVVGTRRP